MTSPSRARAGWWTAAAVAAVVTAGAVVAVRAARHRPAEAVAEHEVPPPVPPPPVPPPPPRGRRLLVAGIVLAVAAVAVILAVTRTTSPAEVAVTIPSASSSPVPSPSPAALAEAPCSMARDATPSSPDPSVPPDFVVPPGELGFPPCWEVVLGTKVVISSGPGELVEATAVPALDEKGRPTVRTWPSGRRRETFRLHFVYLGKDFQGLDIRPVYWARTEPARWIPAVASPYTWLHVSPRREADQFVAFDVEQNARLSRVRISIQPDGNPGTAEWVID